MALEERVAGGRWRAMSREFVGNMIAEGLVTVTDWDVQVRTIVAVINGETVVGEDGTEFRLARAKGTL